MFTGWVTAMFTLQLIGYTVAISSVKKIVVNEWLRLNNSGFLMHPTLYLISIFHTYKESVELHIQRTDSFGPKDPSTSILLDSHSHWGIMHSFGGGHTMTAK